MMSDFTGASYFFTSATLALNCNQIYLITPHMVIVESMMDLLMAESSLNIDYIIVEGIGVPTMGC